MLNVTEDKFMVNQINDATGMKSIDADNRLKAKQQENKEPAADTRCFMDTVSISSTSKQLEALKASLQDISEINEARVLYFKAELQNGNYQINNDRIAQNMLSQTEIA